MSGRHSTGTPVGVYTDGTFAYASDYTAILPALAADAARRRPTTSIAEYVGSLGSLAIEGLAAASACLSPRARQGVAVAAAFAVVTTLAAVAPTHDGTPDWADSHGLAQPPAGADGSGGQTAALGTGGAVHTGPTVLSGGVATVDVAALSALVTPIVEDSWSARSGTSTTLAGGASSPHPSVAPRSVSKVETSTPPRSGSASQPTTPKHSATPTATPRTTVRVSASASLPPILPSSSAPSPRPSPTTRPTVAADVHADVPALASLPPVGVGAHVSVPGLGDVDLDAVLGGRK